MNQNLTELIRSIRSLKKYKEWIQIIRARGKNTCKDCGLMGVPGAIQSHHIVSLLTILKKNKIVTIEQAIECEELWDINNGKLLCSQCHYDNHSEQKIKGGCKP